MAVNGWEIIRIRWPNKIVLSGLFMLILLSGIISDWKITVTPQKAQIPEKTDFNFLKIGQVVLVLRQLDKFY